MTPELTLLFPQWQGAGDARPLEVGARAVAALLPDTLELVEVGLDSVGEAGRELAIERGIHGRTLLVNQLDRALGILYDLDPASILTIGGDCAIELAPVSFLAKKNPRMAVLWVDAHADLNLPEESPSGNLHGMPLRHLLGQGDREIIDRLPQTLQPSSVFLLGARDIDVAEDWYISDAGIRCMTSDQVNSGILDELDDILRSRGLDSLYVHVDLDGLDPQEVPEVWYPTPGGVQVQSLVDLLEPLCDRFRLVGASITEYHLSDGLSAPAVSRILREGFLVN